MAAFKTAAAHWHNLEPQADRFYHDSPGDFEIFVVNVDGSRLRQLTGTRAC